MAQLSLTASDRFPYVGTDLSRRKAIRGGAVAILGGSALAAPVAAGRVNLALQAYEDGRWHHVTWTEGRYYSLCATAIGPGETTTETVPLSGAAITDERNSLTDPARELTPGTYRFALLGSDPYLAVNFQVLPDR